ncbi:hypothetical protein IKS57_03685 [bacterium]|nr:hypothetical protein [bacterium]
MHGYQLNATSSDFDNCEVYFAQLPIADGFGNQQFLTIRAISTKPISINTLQGSSFELDSSIASIPVGSLFT